MPRNRKMSTIGDNSCETRFKIIKRLETGSISQNVVFLVEDTKSQNEKKVIKKIYIESLTHEEVFNILFPVISRLLTFKHENIVIYHEYFIKNEFLYLITEFCEGGDLENILKLHKLNRNQVIDWFSQIIAAVKYFHSIKPPILHSNLKASNILIKNNRLKVCDFDISKTMLSQKDKLKTTIPSPLYRAPDLIKNEIYNLKSDTWSLGVLLFQMCTNHLPFNSEDEIKNNPTPTLPNEFKDMNNILVGMLEKNPICRLDIYQIENIFGKENYQFPSKEVEVKKFLIMVSSKNIFDACENNRKDDVLYYIEDFNKRDSTNSTPLMIASMHGHYDIVKILIDKKCDINALDKNDRNALMNAALKGHANIVELLINNNADRNGKDNKGWTAEGLASWQGNKNVTEVFQKYK